MEEEFLALDFWLQHLGAPLGEGEMQQSIAPFWTCSIRDVGTCKGRCRVDRWIYESELGLGIWARDINLGVVSHGNGYYRLVRREREKEAQDQVWGSQRSEGGEMRNLRWRKGRGSQRRKASRGGHPEPQRGEAL